jgi:hypothetical protein
MDQEKINRLRSAIENQFPGSEIDFRSEEPDWYGFRVGFAPPALILHVEYELVADNPIDFAVDRLMAIGLRDLMPNEGTAPFRVCPDRVEKVRRQLA